MKRIALTILAAALIALGSTSSFARSDLVRLNGRMFMVIPSERIEEMSANCRFAPPAEQNHCRQQVAELDSAYGQVVKLADRANAARQAGSPEEPELRAQAFEQLLDTNLFLNLVQRQFPQTAKGYWAQR